MVTGHYKLCMSCKKPEVSLNTLGASKWDWQIVLNETLEHLFIAIKENSIVKTISIETVELSIFHFQFE